MHCYVDVKNKDQNVEVIGIADKKEIIKVVIDDNCDWIVVQDKSLSGSLDDALKMAELFNDVVIEAKKLRQSKEIQEIDFSLEDDSEEVFEEKLADVAYYLRTLDTMLSDEVLTFMVKDKKGRVYEVKYSMYREYDHSRHIQIDSWSEVE